MSLISSIHIANQALSVNQAAITAVSNNISNVDTVGYSKLNINLESVINYTSTSGGPLALANTLSGVELESIQRASDAYLQSSYWQETSNTSYLDKYTTVASNVEDLMNELSNTGLSDALSDFYAAATNLSTYPSNITARQNYLSAADNLCSTFNNISGDLSSLSQSLVGDPTNVALLSSSEIAGDVSDVNNLLDQIATVNYNIIRTNSSGASSPALLDQRDALVTSLSSLIPLTVTTNDSGTVNLSLGEYSLVKGSVVSGYLNVTSGDATTPAVIGIVNKEGTTLYSNVNSSITSGEIGAILDICGSDADNFTINSVLSGLNTLASEFANVLNTIQTGDPEGDGTTAMCMDSTSQTLIAATDNIFVANGGGAITAANISINSAVSADPYLIAAARVDLTTGVDYSNATGNNSNAALILASRNNTYGALNSSTIEGYLSVTVSQVGADVQNLESKLTSQSTLLTQVESQLNSVTGVNLDEELVNLIKYQRAYQASARIFSVCSDLLEELVNLGK